MEKNVTCEEEGIKVGSSTENGDNDAGNIVKLEIFGQEMLEKLVKASGASGRIYLPPDWVGHLVKVIRID
jgi:putative transposon-encoded protein